MKKLRYVLLIIGTLCCQIRAQNFVLNDGDLVIGFQATSGTGSTKNVFFNVGSATDIRDGKSLGKIGNINETLKTCYGNDWYTRANLFFGAFANFSQGSAVDIEYPDYLEPVNGDPNSTCYISTPASSAGQGSLYAVGSFGNSDLTNGANTFSNVESMCPQLTIQADNSAVLDASEFQLWEISWTKYNPFVQGNQGAAFDSFSGGIQQNFGKGGGATYVDIQRVVATNLGASPQGVVGGGQYVVTIAIGSNGDITLSKAVSSIPIIAITGAPGTLSTTAGTPSDPTSFNVSGANMTAGISVTAQTGFEVSTSPNGTFSNTITVGTSGTIASTPVYVRIPASASSGNFTGNITLSSTGATPKNISVSGTVTAPIPIISVSGSLTALNTTYGTASPTSNFTVSGTNMTAPVTVTAPAGFQVSTSPTSEFATSISVSASGTLANTTIHVRLSPTANAGTYSGNISLTSSGATEKTIATASSTISKATQTIDAIASVGSKAFGDAAFSVISPSSSSSLPVTLSVKSGPASISGNSVTLTGAGTVVIAANQAGNANYNAAAEVTTNFTVSKATQTIAAFASIGTKAFGDAAFAVTAPTSSSSLPVTLSVKSGPATISGNTVTLTGVGTVTLAANQAGNANYNAASEVTTSFSVSKGAQTIGAFTSISNKTFGDASFAVTAPTASSSLPVTLSVKSGPASISGNSVTLTGAGTVVIAANQAGNADYDAATEVTTSFSVSKAAQTIGTFTSIGNKSSGDAPFAVTAPTASSGLAVTLSVKSGPATISGNTVTLTGTGTVVLAANQAGSANYNAATEVTTSFTVSSPSKVDQTIAAIAAVGNKTFGDAPITVTIPTASSNLPVSLTVISGPATISGNMVTLTGTGTVVLAANQAGDDNYNPAPEVTTSFTVSKASQTIAAFVNIENKAFGDLPFAVTAPEASSGLAVSLSVKSGPATISGNSVTLTGSGTVMLAANQAGNENYAAATEVTTSFTVNKATPSITTKPSASAITYGQTLAQSSISGGITSVPGTFTFTNPNTAPSAGSANQSVTFTPTDAANYSTVTTEISVTVNKPAPNITSNPVASAITFGQKLSDSSLSGGTSSVTGIFAFANPNATPSTGISSQSVTFTPNDSINYSSTTVDISVTVNKSTPSITNNPTASAITYGQKLSESTLSSGSASTPGTFAFSNPNTVPSAGSASQSVTFIPTDSTNYNTATTNITVTVNKATPTISNNPTASAITYGQKLSSSTLNGGSASVPGLFAFTNPETSPNTGSANQGITFNPTDNSNYTTASVSISVTVNKATPNITTPPSASSITLGQKLSDSTLSGGIASVNGTFAFTNPNTQPSTAGTSSQSVTFSPADTNNYLTTTTSIDVVTQAGSNPVITTQPIDLTVSQGNSATFSVQATGQNLSYQWKRNGVDIIDARNSSFTVSSTSIATAGEYSVVVSSDNGSQPITSRAAKLIVTFPLADLSINENTSPVLSVSVTGTGLKYQWFKDGMPLRGQTNSTLTLKDITVDQAGTYSVEVTDADGNKFTSQSSKVTVNAVLPEITTQPSNVSVYTGGSATMRVMVKGAGHSYQWKKDGVAIQGEIKNTLSLNDIILSDAGDYTVSVTNSVGTVTSRSARLRVLASNSNNQGGATARPTITSHPISQTVADGSRVLMSVNASGGGLLYQWTKNRKNITGANQPSYTIPSASATASGDYAVIVYNSLGTVTSNIARIAISAPEIDVQQPAGNSLVSSTSKISFGTAKTSSTGIRRTFTIRNTGTTKLTGISFSKRGNHQGDFTVSRSNLREVAPGTSATFTVTFKPAATGARTASIRIASNDRDENPFIINLAGQGAR